MRFGQALAAIRDLRFVEQLLQVNRDFLRLMEDRAREGAVPSLDADETRVEANRIETLRIDYQAKAEVALSSQEHTSELQSHSDLVCRLLLKRKKHVQTPLTHQPR